jgi:hypothetical protein
MLRRQLNALGLLLLAGTLAAALASGIDPTLRSAADQRGERWYRLTVNDRHVGYLHADTRRDALGRWHFDSELRFTLNEGAPVRIVESLRFDATPPWPLLGASQRTERSGQAGATDIDGSAVRFTLKDHLALETWLRDHGPAPDSTAAATAIDFQRQAVTARQFRVVARNATGYQMSQGALLDPTRIQLDARMRPVSMTLAGLFRLEQSSREAALAPPAMAPPGDYFVRLDRRLPDHTRIRRLTLEVEGADVGALWPGLARGSTLIRHAGTVSMAGLQGDELAASDAIPAAHPQIRALAQRAVAGARDDRERALALTAFVHRFLDYREGIAQHPVLELLDHRQGDCTEFADLLTTLARSLGIPSRTVFGLAYADTPAPAFRFHAWNELLVGDEWLVLDPTWNQTRVDATHLPLPDDPTLALGLLTGATSLTFRVREVAYF